MAGSFYRFGRYELSEAEQVLRKDGSVVPLTPKAYATLLVLVRSAGRVVSKTELLETVWSDNFTEEAVLPQAIFLLRKLFADDYPEESPIKTVPRVGYLFREPVLAALEDAPQVLPSPVAESVSAGPEPLESETPGESRSPQPAKQALARPNRYWAVIAGGLCAIALLIYFVHLRSSASAPARYVFTRLTAKADGNPVQTVALSPDGTLIAFSDEDGVKLRSVNDTAVHSLRGAAGVVTTYLFWAPDGIHILQSGVEKEGNRPQIWSLSLTGDDPVLLRDMAANGAPSADGQSIAFLSAARDEVWMMDNSGKNGRRVLGHEDGRTFNVLLWSQNGSELLLQEHRVLTERNPPTAYSSKNDIPYNASYIAVEEATGKITASVPDLWFDDACLDAQGALLMATSTYDADRSTQLTMWRVKLDPENGTLASTPTKIADAPSKIKAITCSPRTGEIVAALQHVFPHVFVADLQWTPPALGDIRRLTSDDADAFPHAWMADGSGVFFESNVSGHNQIYLQRLDRKDGEAILPSTAIQFAPRLVHDTPWLLFVEDRKTLSRTKLTSGVAEPVVTKHPSVDFRCALSAPDCVLKSTNASEGTLFSDLDPVEGEGKVLFHLPTTWGALSDWDVSPDGQQLVCVTANGGVTQIHTVVLASQALKEIPLAPTLHPLAVNWVPKRNGWIIGAPTLHGGSLLYLDPTGKTFPLRQTYTVTYGVPSPDGSKLTFKDFDGSGNMWMLKPASE